MNKVLYVNIIIIVFALLFISDCSKSEKENPVIPEQIDSTVSLVKPLSKGPVRINGKTLEQDFDADGVYKEYIVKGAAFSPSPIGGGNVPLQIIDRSMQYLIRMNANTIRTYSGADDYLLKTAAKYGIHVNCKFLGKL